MTAAELGGLLFILCVLYVAPAALFWLLGGWPTLAAFLFYAFIAWLVGHTLSGGRSRTPSRSPQAPLASAASAAGGPACTTGATTATRRTRSGKSTAAAARRPLCSTTWPSSPCSSRTCRPASLTSSRGGVLDFLRTSRALASLQPAPRRAPGRRGSPPHHPAPHLREVRRRAPGARGAPRPAPRAPGRPLGGARLCGRARMRRLPPHVFWRRLPPRAELAAWLLRTGALSR